MWPWRPCLLSGEPLGLDSFGGVVTSGGTISGDRYFPRVVRFRNFTVSFPLSTSVFSRFKLAEEKNISSPFTSTLRWEGQHKGCKESALHQFELVGAGKLSVYSGITNEFWMNAMQVYNVLLLLLSRGLESWKFLSGLGCTCLRKTKDFSCL